MYGHDSKLQTQDVKGVHSNFFEPTLYATGTTYQTTLFMLSTAFEVKLAMNG